MALRLLERPEAIEVEREDEMPRALRWRGRRLTIEHAVGPERLSGDWWKDGYRRDYWRCECAGETAEYMVFAAEGGWFLQGWWD